MYPNGQTADLAGSVPYRDLRPLYNLRLCRAYSELRCTPN
jgi:hypothetical protein